MIHFGAKSTTDHGPIIRINCPYCHALDAQASTGLVETTSTLFFIPLQRSEETLVKCLACKTVFRSKASIQALAEMTPEQIDSAGALRFRFDLVAAAAPILAIPFTVIPVLNILVPLLAVYVVRKQPIWVRMIAWTVFMGAAILGSLIWYRRTCFER